MAEWHFQPGTSGNPNGRPTGSRNKRTKDLWDLLDKRGDRDPVEFQSQIVSDETIPLETRLQAAANIAPFRHSKCGAMPPLRFISEPVTLPCPNPTTTNELDRNIAHIVQLYAAGNLDLDSYAALLAGQREHTVSFKAREEVDPTNQNIHITGGLPSLPGTNITMPKLNGHEVLGLVPPNDPPITPPQDPDQPPAIPPEQEAP
jgi:Family of unknown function (DUF5681)